MSVKCLACCVAHTFIVDDYEHNSFLSVRLYLPCLLVIKDHRFTSCAGPFSHRMMMTMEEKGISYHKNLLDEQKMPDW